MAIRLSGMNSNLDTDSIVKALVSAYSVTKDNLVKSQTKLSWQKDSWKSMNTKIYTFYSKSLANSRLSSSYSKKSSSISDSTIAKVSSSTSAVNGTQSLEVGKLASSGYLTGGTISKTTGEDVTSTSKLSEISGFSTFTSGSINVGVGTNATTIDLTADTTVAGFVNKLKESGVNASFDETNQRFFVSAKTSGADNDFTLTAGDSGGLTALQSFGMYTSNATDTAEYTKWANYTASDITTLKADGYTAAATNSDKVATEYKDIYDNASVNVTSLQSTNVALETQKANGTLTADDIAKIQAKIDANDVSITTYQKTMSDNLKYVPLGTDDAATVTAKKANIQTEVDSRNVTIKNNVEAAIDAKVAIAKNALTITTGSTGAVRTVGTDSSIVLNGATYTSSTNNFNINGLTIQAQNLTQTGKPVTVTTDTDVDGIYDMIKGLFTEYNTLINGMDAAYNADNAKGYQPLTVDEKAAMSDTEVEAWEKKIKDALLRKDSTLDGIDNALKTNMLGGFKVNGKTTTLATYGINTLSYFTSADNEKGAYHIDGDTKDTNTSGNADKLRAAIASDPDAVVSFYRVRYIVI